MEPMDLRESILEIFRQAGRPVHQSKILNEIFARGALPPGEESRRKILRAILEAERAGILRKRGPGVYEPA